MAAEPDYVSGTISLTNGAVEFTGAGTGWLLAQFKAGDTIIDITGATEYMGVIETIDANGAGTLTKAWEGPTLVDVAYRMRYQPDGARVSAQARNLIELLGNGNLQAVAGLSGSANQVLMFTGPGTMTTVPKTDLVSGAAYDVQVADLAARAAYDGQTQGFAVLVANTGDGRAAIYAKNTNGSADWSAPAYVTGPAITLDITEVDEVPYGTPPDVTLTPVGGGYNLAFDIPAGMIIEPGTTTTLAPDQPAAVTFVPVTGGYRLDIAIPRGPTGDINGVTPFWNTRLGSDDSQAAALAGLGAQPAGDYLTQAEARTMYMTQPQGRLTFQSGKSVMSGNVLMASTVYYTPHEGRRLIPIWNGADFELRLFSELALVLDSNAAHVQYHMSGGLFEIGVFDDAGTLRLGTVMWDGVAPERESINGLWVNKNPFTVRFGTGSADTRAVPARCMTLVGIMGMIAAGLSEWSPKPAEGLTARLYLSNMYNRQLVYAIQNESLSSWERATVGVRAVNGETANAIILNLALDDIPVAAEHHMMVQASTTTSQPGIGIGIGSTAVNSAPTTAMVSPAGAGLNMPLKANYYGALAKGVKIIYALEDQGSTGSVTYTGSFRQALTVAVEM